MHKKTGGEVEEGGVKRSTSKIRCDPVRSNMNMRCRPTFEKEVVQKGKKRKTEEKGNKEKETNVM